MELEATGGEVDSFFSDGKDPLNVAMVYFQVRVVSKPVLVNVVDVVACDKEKHPKRVSPQCFNKIASPRRFKAISCRTMRF